MTPALRTCLGLGLLLSLLGASPTPPGAIAGKPADASLNDPEAFAGARSEMVTRVRSELLAAGLSEDRRLREILQILRRLPREAFVPADQRASAYSMRPLPIGQGQTISDAFIMAYMTRKLNLNRRDRVLEIGTGSGYQAAVLGSLVDRVYTIEIIPELAQRASAVLKEQRFDNVEVRQGDGYLGWPDRAPFDAIIVTAGAVRIPPALLAQLRPGGRMVLPLGPNWAEQRMTLVRKRSDGRPRISSCGWVAFVPFVGAAQRPEARAPGVWGGRLSPKCHEPLGVQWKPVPPEKVSPSPSSGA